MKYNHHRAACPMPAYPKDGLGPQGYRGHRARGPDISLFVCPLSAQFTRPSSHHHHHSLFSRTCLPPWFLICIAHHNNGCRGSSPCVASRWKGWWMWRCGDSFIGCVLCSCDLPFPPTACCVPKNKPGRTPTLLLDPGPVVPSSTAKHRVHHTKHKTKR